MIPARASIYLELTKFRIASFSTLSAATGYLVSSGDVDWGLLTCCVGLLLLGLGACALNEWQDRAIDARMRRTRGRPLPAGKLAPMTALGVSIALVASGFLVLFVAHGTSPAALGLLAVVWYNGVYTYLKRISAFAVVPGALIGAVPPIVGWAAAGGSPSDPGAIALGFFFFMWQVPHFWLLLFIHGDDYVEAGLPSVTGVFSKVQLARLTFLWSVATAASSLLLYVYGVIGSPYIALGLFIVGVWLGWLVSAILRDVESRSAFGKAFGGINVYALVVMALAVADALAL